MKILFLLLFLIITPKTIYGDQNIGECYCNNTRVMLNGSFVELDCNNTKILIVLSKLFGARVTHVPTRNTFLINTNYNPIVIEPIFTQESLPEHIIELITGSSWHYHSRIHHSELRYVTITHVDFYGYSRLGHMIINQSIADEVLEIFREIYDARFPIARMKLIDFYNATDYYSMADNNSVSFNYRNIAGTNNLSRHALGMAIDINPMQNPYRRGDTILPVAGYAYFDRYNIRPGMIIPGEAIYNAFISRGWTWGGRWTMPIDYHHFERR